MAKPKTWGSVVLLTALLLAGGLATGCEETNQSASDTAAAAVNSGIEGVPIPANAKAEGGEIWTVPAMSYDELKSWYEEEMPVGEDFKAWNWCDTGGGEDSNFTLIYSQGAKRILAVAMVADEPNGLIIGADESGPC